MLPHPDCLAEQLATKFPTFLAARPIEFEHDR
ncbi:MAG: hypothetical protein ACI841_003355 [Planctomycetota bacterium]|jgi:hypothetical protein